jgi:hypothetical protein
VNFLPAQKSISPFSQSRDKHYLKIYTRQAFSATEEKHNEKDHTLNGRVSENHYESTVTMSQ